MKKVLLAHPMNWLGKCVENITLLVPGLYSTNNFEQVKGMIKSGEVERLGIMCGGLLIEAQEAAEKIHKINKDIPILVWGMGTPKYIKNKNEYYLEDYDLPREPYYNVIQNFYSNKLLNYPYVKELQP